MGWVYRRGRSYYYLSARVGGVPRRVYLGTGAAARLHELLTAQERRAKAKRSRSRKERAAAVATLAAGTRGLVDRVRQLTRAVRLLNGEYQHKGTWRRRGMNAKRKRGPEERLPLTEPVRPARAGEADDVGAVLVALNDRANAGDPAALAEIRTLLDRHPQVWMSVGGKAAELGAGWGGLLTARHVALGECAERYVAAWKAGLLGPAPTPLLRAAVDAAAVSMLAVKYSEADLQGVEAGGRAAAARRLAAAARQHTDALKLVAAVAARDAVQPRAAAESSEGSTAEVSEPVAAPGSEPRGVPSTPAPRRLAPALT